jgi:tagatose 6-phosphate kinase
VTAVVVALNPTLDLTYDVDRLVPGTTHRVAPAAARAGGKALNVARVLAALGEDVRVVGLGPADLVAAWAAEPGAPPARWVTVAGASRRTIAVVERGGPRVTSFNDPGPVVATAAWTRLLGMVSAHLPAAALVLSGRLPPGLPDAAYAVLVRLAQAAGAAVIVDTSGPALAHALAAGPDLAKPNLHELAELAELVGQAEVAEVAGPPRSTTVPAVAKAARSLRDGGVGAVCVSLGARGLVAATDAGCWWARPPEVAAGNPTGAGDAVVASLVATARSDLAWPERLCRAAALGAAAVLTPVAGAVDLAAYDALRPRTTAEPL